MQSHKNQHGVRRLIAALTLVAVPGLIGCLRPTSPGGDDALGPPEPRHVVVDRVNRNAAAMDFLLRAGGVTVEGELRQGDRRESFRLQGTLLFQRPRDLYVKLEHIGGTVEAGSNATEFWFWEKIGEPRYRWGEHAHMRSVPDATMPVPPDLLVEALGVGELPAETTGPAGPVWWVGSRHYELLFLEPSAEGLWLRKAVDIDRAWPHLVRSIVYFDRVGRPVVQAHLGDYAEIQGSEVLAPRRLEIRWLPDRGEIRISFDTMKRFESSSAVLERFVSPRQRGMDVGWEERVDEPWTDLEVPTSLPAELLESSAGVTANTSQPAELIEAPTSGPQGD